MQYKMDQYHYRRQEKVKEGKEGERKEGDRSHWENSTITPFSSPHPTATPSWSDHFCWDLLNDVLGPTCEL